MKSARGLWLAALALLLGSFSIFAVALPEKSIALSWRKNKTADAQIESVPLAKVLSRLSTETGWKIFLQPGLNETVSAQFQNVSQGEALKLLLGDLSYAFVPQSGGGAKLYVYKTSIKDATSLIRPDLASRPKNWLANELILSLAPGSKQDIDRLAAELGGKVVAKSDALNAYRVEFPDAASAEAAREKIANREDVAYHDNYGFDRPQVAGSGSPSPESLFPLDATPVTRGDQVTVALVDTAIQTLNGKMQEFILPSVHIRDTPTAFPQDPTHATSMAQTVLNSMALNQENSASGKVRILPIDVYGSAGSTTTFEVAQGLHYAIKSGAQVINLSLGGTGQSPMVDYLLEMANRKQILVLASAGNSPTTDPTYPAANPYTIAVTATDWQGNIAPYANRGSFVDLKAPGTSKVYYNGQGYLSTGTSTATAYMSGQAAALTAAGYNSAQASSALLKNYSFSAKR